MESNNPDWPSSTVVRFTELGTSRIAFLAFTYASSLSNPYNNHCKVEQDYKPQLEGGRQRWRKDRGCWKSPLQVKFMAEIKFETASSQLMQFVPVIHTSSSPWKPLREEGRAWSISRLCSRSPVFNLLSMANKCCPGEDTNSAWPTLCKRWDVKM